MSTLAAEKPLTYVSSCLAANRAPDHSELSRACPTNGHTSCCQPEDTL